MKIREITHVDELNGVFRVRFDYIKEWRDHNLKFKNLHENIVNAVRHSSMNTLTSYYLRGHFIIIMINRLIEYLPTSPGDQSKIWVPYTIFFNIESQKKIKHSDKKEVMKVVPNPDNYYTLPDAVNSSQK